jgi:hypothetical protein
MFVNRKLISHSARFPGLARQIDIAPTILDLLGFDVPPAWQGTTLLSENRPSRAYLFAIAGNFTMGLVEGDYVYIDNYTRDRQELYNVRTDPQEHHDLASAHATDAAMSCYHLRLEAWLAFQNGYLDRFTCVGCAVARKDAESIKALADGDSPARDPDK